jgi:hypothetical protein
MHQVRNDRASQKAGRHAWSCRLRLARIPWLSRGRLTREQTRDVFVSARGPGTRRAGQRLLEPVGDEAGAGMDVHGFVTVGSGRELMRCLSRGNEYLAGTAGHLAGTDGEGRAAASDDERLRVGMLAWSW